jgi:hypothetical protein
MSVFIAKIFNKATVKVKKILHNDINEQNFSVSEPDKMGREREREGREREEISAH